MQNPPIGTLLAEDHGPAGQAPGVAEVRRNHDEPDTQRLNAARVIGLGPVR